MRYSAKENGFFPEDIDYGDTLPDDLVELTHEEYVGFIDGQYNRKMIVPDNDGFPMLVDLPGPTAKDIVEQAEQDKLSLISYASLKVATLQDALDLDMATDIEKNSLSSWRKYRVLLSRVDTSKAPDISWPNKPE